MGQLGDAAYAPMRAATAGFNPGQSPSGGAIESNPQASRTFRTLGRRNLFALRISNEQHETRTRADKKRLHRWWRRSLAAKPSSPGKGNEKGAVTTCLLATGIGAVTAKRRLCRNRRA